MIGQGLAQSEIALLCRLYYLEPAPAQDLIAAYQGRNELHTLVADRLAGTGIAEAQACLERLRAELLVTRNHEGWRLTEQGRALAYEVGERHIQRLSGFWSVVAKLLPTQPSFTRVVDIGCGGGGAGLVIREAGMLAPGGVYIGMDISYAALTAGIELSRRGGGDIATVHVQGTAYHMPFAGGAIDCCVSRSTLYYLQKGKALAEMARVVRKGGLLIVAVPTIGYMARRALHGWSTLRPREAIKYTAATLLGIVAWLGADVRPPPALFTGETKRSLRARLARIPELRLVLLKRLALPFVGHPLLLVAEKLA
jgi:SAM-dependent methyltransferase